MYQSLPPVKHKQERKLYNAENIKKRNSSSRQQSLWSACGAQRTHQKKCRNWGDLEQTFSCLVVSRRVFLFVVWICFIQEWNLHFCEEFFFGNCWWCGEQETKQKIALHPHKQSKDLSVCWYNSSRRPLLSEEFPVMCPFAWQYVFYEKAPQNC